MKTVTFLQIIFSQGLSSFFSPAISHLRHPQGISPFWAQLMQLTWDVCSSLWTKLHVIIPHIPHSQLLFACFQCRGIWPLAEREELSWLSLWDLNPNHWPEKKGKWLFSCRHKSKVGCLCSKALGDSDVTCSLLMEMCSGPIGSIFSWRFLCRRMGPSQKPYR